MSQPTSETTANHFEKLPQWFVPAAGIIYATGFLIVFSFLERFSVRETGDFFKVKYIHAGIMYWLFPIIVVVPPYCFYVIKRLRQEATDAEIERLRQESSRAVESIDPANKDARESMATAFSQRIEHEKKRMEPLKLYVASVVLVINMLLVFYVFAMFAPIGFASQREHLIFVIFAATLIGIIGIRVAIPERFGLRARWLLCFLIIVGLDLYAFHGLFGHLWKVFWGGGKYFLLLLFLIALTIERTRVRTLELQDRRQKILLRIIALCIVFALYYLSVLAFSLRLYPYIPVLKGGGDYVATPNVVLCFQGANTTLNLPEIAGRSETNDCLPSKSLQIIEETTTSLFLADPSDAGGPAEWRETGKKPRVFEVRRDRIASITYVNH